jgi:hypothetical protein
VGNRAYVTIEKSHYRTSYYLHWNGGIDTIAPVCKVLFDHNANKPEDFEALMKACEIRIQRQADVLPTNKTEENGHYLINLDKQTLEQTPENMTALRWIPHLKDEFESFVRTKIKAEYRDEVRKNYWDGILEIGSKTFNQTEKEN